jgi:glyoxylase-like metal-dependent hydrolase (beta-lactamase superfamily II)
MIVARSMHPRWLSNTWLCADRPGGHAFVVDTGGLLEPIARRIAELGVTLTHVLCTHHHHDHVAHNADYRLRHGVPVCGHVAERDLFGGLDVELEDRQEIAVGALRVRALHIPGHTRGQLAFAVPGHGVFTGDTLFRGSVGGTRAPGHATFAELRASILDVLMALPHELRVWPGHMDETTLGREWDANPFVRLWRGLDRPVERACTALGEPATLMLRATDYDGGTKCQVRFAGGRIDVVPGSRVVEG